MLEIEKGNLSDNHLVRTNKGFVKAKNLKIGDKILGSNGETICIINTNETENEKRERIQLERNNKIKRILK